MAKPVTRNSAAAPAAPATEPVEKPAGVKSTITTEEIYKVGKFAPKKKKDESEDGK